jgi:hypothetical protein
VVRQPVSFSKTSHFLPISLHQHQNEEVTMGIVLRDVSDADIARACEVEAAAYADNPLGPLFFPGPFPPGHAQKRVSYLIETRKTDPTANYLQAYDEETGQLIAFAKWHIYDNPEAATAAVRSSRAFGPGENKEALEAFFGTLKEKKEKHMGGKLHLCKLALLL